MIVSLDAYLEPNLELTSISAEAVQIVLDTPIEKVKEKLQRNLGDVSDVMIDNDASQRNSYRNILSLLPFYAP